MYRLTFERLLTDLYAAYLDARRHKRRMPYQQKFEGNLASNLYVLCRELWTRTYRPRPSTCFIITDPKQREVFAADFRDRIVHHLYYNYTHELFERTFIADSCSCIKGRGTHYGISRLKDHIRSESRGFTRECWVMKMDIKGYFMHIDRSRLLEIATGTLRRLSRREPYASALDLDFVLYLTRLIVTLDPLDGCRIAGRPSDWNGLPDDKSLFKTRPGCGLPIGNLTSQLFSNVYLGEFDRFMKREMGCRHYGRYVDDSYVVSCDRRWLEGLVPQAETFLRERLGLELHRGKLRIDNVYTGVEFVGAFLRPHTTYIARGSLGRLKRGLAALGRTYAVNLDRPDAKSAGCNEANALNYGNAGHIFCSLNSYLGVLSHYDSYNLRQRLFLESPSLEFSRRLGSYTSDLTKFRLNS